jgi:hypothetical protein
MQCSLQAPLLPTQRVSDPSPRRVVEQHVVFAAGRRRELPLRLK